LSQSNATLRELLGFITCQHILTPRDTDFGISVCLSVCHVVVLATQMGTYVRLCVTCSVAHTVNVVQYFNTRISINQSINQHFIDITTVHS